MIKIRKIILGPLLTNCYFLISQKDALLIDPAKKAKSILTELEKIKAKLRMILLTHYHQDHTLGAEDLAQKTGAKIFIHEKEKEFIDFKVDVFLKDGQKIKFDKLNIEICHTPGHSQGSICIFVKNFRLKEIKEDIHLWEEFKGGEGFVFSGDTLFENGVGRTDLPGGSIEKLNWSLNKLKKILKKGMRIYPGHGRDFFYE